MPVPASFSQAVDSLPSFIQPSLLTLWQQIEDYYATPPLQWPQSQCPWSEAFLQDLAKAGARSDYIIETCAKYPQWLAAWAKPDSDLYQQQALSCLKSELAECMREVTTVDGLMQVLRIFRRKQMCRLLWRDLLKLATLEQTLIEVSHLADVCIQTALDWLHLDAVAQYGEPRSACELRQPQHLVVLGMGKLGACELNVSSDIDLIFAFPENGQTDHPAKPIDNHKFFTRLGQRLINALDSITADGFVFRVDMRLRPYGSAGALALNFSAFEDYYQNQGREWERFAMIKARAITGEPAAQERLLDIIRPFVYRRYTDFSSFQALREMKRLISSEVHRKGGQQNIKLGEGGIREVEFIAQACQLIYGGRDADLQQSGLLPVLALLQAKEYLPQQWVADLQAANVFLRNMEHAIQGLADKQTQQIPSTEQDCERVAWSLAYTSWSAAEKDLQAHRDKVSRVFSDFLQEPEAESETEADNSSVWLHLWQAQAEEAEWVEAFRAAGFQQPLQSYKILMAVSESRVFSAMSADSRQRFEQFLPLLLTVVSDGASPDITLERVLGFVRSILGRTIYLVLLYENPAALALLCQLCSDSPWIAEHIAKSPVILDELLDAKSLYQPPNRQLLHDELRQHLLRIPEDDLEAQMDGLRNFRQSHMLRVAAAELSGKLPLMKVSDYLTWLAECLVEQSVAIAWKNLVDRHGLPSGLDDNSAGSGFAVVAYGKLGGIELSYHSDLDMVFLYDADDHGMTQGERSINNQVFYTRLGQRIIHILSTSTTQGELYEVDMRLRPSGKSGMLVSSLAAFEKYQKQDAWTWEHQALVRTRAIVGDARLCQAFEALRCEVLGMARDPEKLRSEVLSMRNKMLQAATDELKSEQDAQDDIKQGLGGLIDIEFMTQYSVLLKASVEPELLDWSDNIRLLEVLSRKGCFEGLDFLPLIDDYRSLRSARHRKSLADERYQVSLKDFPELRARVRSLWEQLFH